MRLGSIHIIMKPRSQAHWGDEPGNEANTYAFTRMMKFLLHLSVAR